MTRMSEIMSRMRARNANMELMRAVNGASTPALRSELLSIVQRDMR